MNLIRKLFGNTPEPKEKTEPDFPQKAVAYLKAALPHHSSAITLAPEDNPIVETLCDGLCICYIVDEGQSYTYIQRRHLDKSGMNLSQLHSIGLDNLIHLTANRNLRVQRHQNIFAVLMGGDFEASLILMDQLWDQHFRQFVKGEYAVAIPNRDILAFCDSSSASGLKELQDLIDRIYKTGDHPISDIIYIRHEKTWKKNGA